jgi:electron transfer flavoprotein beta subunit
MRILVCVKGVPDLQSERSFTNGRITRGADDGMNDLDEHAVEAAVRLVEQDGGEVVAVTVGGPDSVAAVRRALQLGATRAIRVTDDAIAGSDVFGTARVLAAVARVLNGEAPLDLILTGMASLDGLTSMLPAALAAELDWPQLTLASSLAVAGGSARIERHLPDAHEILEAALPAVVSVTDEANKPRYPNFVAIIAARSAEISAWDLADLGVEPSGVGAAGARTRVLSATPRPARTNRRVVNDSGEGGVALAAFLVEREFA